MENNQHCGDLLQTLSDYIDGEISPLLCAELEKHLSTCENCRIVVNTLRKTIELYQAEPEITGLPGEVRSRLFARLELVDFSHPENRDSCA